MVLLLLNISALDAQVGRSILSDTILGLLKGKTRILVTHRVEAANFADEIYIMKEGRIVEKLNRDNLNHSFYYQQLIRNDRQSERKETIPFLRQTIFRDSEPMRSTIISSPSSDEENNNDTQPPVESPFTETDLNDKLMLEEDREIGHVGLPVWKSFIAYFGGSNFFLILISGNFLKKF